jgi:hypothetical protein
VIDFAALIMARFDDQVRETMIQRKQNEHKATPLIPILPDSSRAHGSRIKSENRWHSHIDSNSVGCTIIFEVGRQRLAGRSIKSRTDDDFFPPGMSNDRGVGWQWQRLSGQPISFWADRVKSVCKIAHFVAASSPIGVLILEVDQLTEDPVHDLRCIRGINVLFDDRRRSGLPDVFERASELCDFFILLIEGFVRASELESFLPDVSPFRGQFLPQGTYLGLEGAFVLAP